MTATATPRLHAGNNDTFDLADATEVYGDREILDLLDESNDCDHPGGHLYLTQCGETRCVHCRKRVT